MPVDLPIITRRGVTRVPLHEADATHFRRGRPHLSFNRTGRNIFDAVQVL